ncbi:MAG TPA: C4-type zinc ribbon domain-containing protein [Acidimicrobiales bacterium]
MSESLTVLLELQEHDTRADQHRHRRASLPQRAELAAIERELASIDADVARVSAARDALAREEKRIEDEAASVAAKAAAEDKRLYSGTVTAAKELQSIQDEIAALQRRQRALEDEALELMVQIEPLDEELAAHRARRDEVAARADDLRARLRELEAEIDAQLAQLDAERGAIVERVDAPILAEYESLRARLGGVAVAKLEAGSCRGCHLQLSAVELDRIKKIPRNEIVHCEECGRILVR